MTAHMPGPWELSATGAVIKRAAVNKVIATMPDQSHANAARIVACVNACEGMDDPVQEIAALRHRADMSYERVPISEIDGLTDRERELAAALRDLLNLSDARGYLPSQNIAPVEAARAALAKVQS